MSNSIQIGSVLCLPPEIYQEIFTWIGEPQQIGVLRLVSQQFRVLADRVHELRLRSSFLVKVVHELNGQVNQWYNERHNQITPFNSIVAPLDIDEDMRAKYCVGRALFSEDIESFVKAVASQSSEALYHCFKEKIVDALSLHEEVCIRACRVPAFDMTFATPQFTQCDALDIPQAAVNLDVGTITIEEEAQAGVSRAVRVDKSSTIPTLSMVLPARSQPGQKLEQKLEYTHPMLPIKIEGIQVNTVDYEEEMEDFSHVPRSVVDLQLPVELFANFLDAQKLEFYLAGRRVKLWYTQVGRIAEIIVKALSPKIDPLRQNS